MTGGQPPGPTVVIVSADRVKTVLAALDEGPHAADPEAGG
jgi:hypothetical protein